MERNVVHFQTGAPILTLLTGFDIVRQISWELCDHITVLMVVTVAQGVGTIPVNSKHVGFLTQPSKKTMHNADYIRS